MKCTSDFIGSVIGSSEKQTRDILAAASGCVLVIDEAYSLCSVNGSTVAANDPYKTAVIDTLVEQIQARPGDDRVVILVGYKKEMENMFRNVNPGLSRRFQMENAFTFSDYSDDALIRILRQKASAAGFDVSAKVAVAALEPLRKAHALPNFGNAGAIENLLSKSKERFMSRPNNTSTKNLELVDFFSKEELAIYHHDSQPSACLKDIVGCDDIKTTMCQIELAIKNCKA